MVLSERTRLIALSQLLQVYAEQARWDELQILEADFNQQLQAYFADQQDDELAAQLLEQNQQIQKILKAEQAKITGQQAEELKSLKAMRSYLEAN